MGLKEDIIAMKQEVEEVKKQSFAMEMLKDSKRANKRICWSFSLVLMMLILAYFATVALFLRYINQIEDVDIITNTKTQELSEIDSIQNSNIINGDMYGENKAN